MRSLTLMAMLVGVGAGMAETPQRLASGVSGHIHPAFCISKKGTLVVIFGQSDYKDLQLTRSTDGGKTWSKPKLFEPSAKQSIYPGSLTTLRDGRIVHLWNVWYSTGKTDKNGKALRSRYPEYSISDDEGLTWSTPKALPKNPDAERVNRHPFVELSPKAWLISLMDTTIVYDPTTEKSTPFGDGQKHGLTPIVRTPKGTFVTGYGQRSTDDGKTWTKITPFPKIGDNGWRFDLVALPNGWLVAGEVEGEGIGGNKWRFVVSRDDGLTWDFTQPHEFYNPNRPIGGRACPKSVLLDKDTLGTIFYDTDAKQTGGAGVFFLRTPLAQLAK